MKLITSFPDDADDFEEYEEAVENGAVDGDIDATTFDYPAPTQEGNRNLEEDDPHVVVPPFMESVPDILISDKVRHSMDTLYPPGVELGLEHAVEVYRGLYRWMWNLVDRLQDLGEL